MSYTVLHKAILALHCELAACKDTSKHQIKTRHAAD